MQRLTKLAICLTMICGCSAETKEKAKDALNATGQAAKSATEDAKVNAKKAAEVVKSAGDKAKEEFSTPPASTPPAKDADRYRVPAQQP